MTEAMAPDRHEKFKQLSALANTGALSAAELLELRDHLELCGQCREVHEQYRGLSEAGMPVLAATYATGQETDWDDAATRKKLFARVREEARRSQQRIRFFPAAADPGVALGNRFGFGGGALAACILLILLASGYFGGRAYFGQKRQAIVDNGLHELVAEKSLAQERMSAQAQRITRLQEESAHKEADLGKLRLSLRTVTDHANDLATARGKSEEQLRSVSQQRDSLLAKIKDAEESAQSIQAELVGLRAEREQVGLRTASLESKIEELTATNREQERELKDDRQYLTSDRDIRELMGARKLYIADVFDVDSGSRTKKPFGRVFYTQGKSLIFYAFDLDTGVKNANFQVWGRKETAQGEQPKPMNLGILYMDNETNRRWVMRFDDSKQLADIDAVFVTVEPRGGSPKPTSKPFLYALLRKEVNHP